MPSISSTGLGSGLDINNLVETLTESEKAPQQERLDLRKSTADATISGVATLKSALSSFQSALSGLADADNLEILTASSSDEDVFTASVNSTAVAGNYSIQVKQLAQGDKYSSDQFFAADDTLVGTATAISMSVGGNSFSVTLGVNDTLADLRNNIMNAADNPGVIATIVSSDAGQSLVITSSGVGADSAITFDSLGTSGLTFTNTTPAQDSIVSIDGNDLTSASNLVTNAITGVTLALDKADPGVTKTLSIFKDPGVLEEQVSELVDAYNQLFKTLSELQYGYENEDGEVVAPLMPNDVTLRSLMTQIRRTFTSSVEGNGNYSSLASLGVETNRNGTVSLDVRVLRSALDSGLSNMPKLFSESDVGIAYRLDQQIDTYLKFEGVLDQRTESAETQLERIAKDQATLDLRIEKFQTRLFAQFNQMDAIVGLLGNTGSYLEQQLATLPLGGGLNKDR